MLPPHGGGGRTYQASYFLLSPISPPAEDVYLIFRAPASFFLTAQVILLQELTLVFIHILDDPPSLFWKMYLLKKICICTCVCVWVCAYSHGTCGGQKEALELRVLELGQLWSTCCGCWELSTGPLEESQVLLTTEPLLQPHYCFSLPVILATFCKCA